MTQYNPVPDPNEPAEQYNPNPSTYGQYNPNPSNSSQYNPNGNQQQNQPSQFEVMGSNLADKVKELIHEGNVREIIVKHDGHTILHIPVTVGIIGAVLAPQLAAVAAIGALLTHCTIEVVRSDRP